LARPTHDGQPENAPAPHHGHGSKSPLDKDTLMEAPATGPERRHLKEDWARRSRFGLGPR